MEDTYDEQIQALLNDEYDLWMELASVDPEDEAYPPIDSHYEAWNQGAAKGSIFAELPGCGGLCASSIEYRSYQECDTTLVNKILRDKKVWLPNLLGNEKGKDFRFTEEELKEFARRQRVANEARMGLPTA